MTDACRLSLTPYRAPETITSAARPGKNAPAATSTNHKFPSTAQMHNLGESLNSASRGCAAVSAAQGAFTAAWHSRSSCCHAASLPCACTQQQHMLSQSRLAAGTRSFWCLHGEHWVCPQKQQLRSCDNPNRNTPASSSTRTQHTSCLRPCGMHSTRPLQVTTPAWRMLIRSSTTYLM